MTLERRLRDNAKLGDVVDAENEAMRYLRSKKFPCAFVYPAAGTSETKLYTRVPKSSYTDDEIDGKVDGDRNEQEKEECIIRLLSFLPGETAESLGSLSQENLFYIGQFIGRLSRDLQDFASPVLTKKSDRWSLENFLSLEEYITFVKDEETQRLLLGIMRKFQTQVNPKLSLFRPGIIHSDVSPDNLLVDTTRGSFEISGLIDFCDMRQTCLVFELANAIASFINQDNVLEDSGHLVAGYQAVFPIPDLEFHLLYDVVLVRLCQVLLITNKEKIKDPDNKYLSYILEKNSSILTAWLKNPRDEVTKYWREICQKNLIK